MKLKVLLFIGLLSIKGFSQFGEQQIITTIAEAARSSYPADLDGDGDMDVISASFGDNKVAWYENLDGQGNFGEQIIINEYIVDPLNVFPADFDNDGDLDIVCNSFNNVGNPDVVWFKNLDGQGTFGQPIEITYDAFGAIDVYSSDLDNDGDMDVLSASKEDNKIAWYENLDGQGTFGEQQILTTNALSARTVYAGDINGDGNIDVISSSLSDGEVIWFKNNGNGNFEIEQVISNTVGAVLSVYAEDMDGDGDMDVLSASYINKVSWHENLDGLGTFNNEHIISELTNGAHSVHAEDMDNDGDMDVLSASAIDNKIAWYENLDGQGNFGEQLLIDQENIIQGRDVFAADLDDDGDMDVLAASQNNQTIAWYENFTILEIEDNESIKLSIYPNPTNGLIYIEGLSKVTSIKVYDDLGRLVFKQNNPSNQIDISSLSTGLLFVQIETDNGSIIKKVIKE